MTTMVTTQPTVLSSNADQNIAAFTTARASLQGTCQALQDLDRHLNKGQVPPNGGGGPPGGGPAGYLDPVNNPNAYAHIPAAADV